MKKYISCSVLLCFVVLAGCNNNAPTSANVEKVVKREGQPDIDYVASEDKAMNAAIQKARATFGTFIVAFSKRKANQNSFAIKQKFTDANGSEHMWIGSLKFDGKSFRGRLNNEPYEVKTAKLGDNISVDSKELSDWMYIENGKLVGGYTIRVLTNKMSPSERKSIEKEGGYKLD